jgi:dipeptidyl aminopeptidase/acylaminoacyl peptidase
VALPWQGQIVLAASDGGWPVPLTSTTGGKTGLDWSADGRTLAFVSGGAIWTVPASGGPPVRLTEGARGAGDPRRAADSAPQWSPTGNWILFETGRRGNGDLALISRDGLTTSVLTSSAADEGNAAWSPMDRRSHSSSGPPSTLVGACAWAICTPHQAASATRLASSTVLLPIGAADGPFGALCGRRMANPWR